MDPATDHTTLTATEYSSPSFDLHCRADRNSRCVSDLTNSFKYICFCNCTYHYITKISLQNRTRRIRTGISLAVESFQFDFDCCTHSYFLFFRYQNILYICIFVEIQLSFPFLFFPRSKTVLQRRQHLCLVRIYSFKQENLFICLHYSVTGFLILALALLTVFGTSKLLFKFW